MDKLQNLSIILSYLKPSKETSAVLRKILLVWYADINKHAYVYVASPRHK